MTTYFISDLHLHSPDSLVYSGFRDFLRAKSADADALYILGDFFDAWIGDDDETPFINEVKDLLRAFSYKAPVYLCVGNRDFLLGERFAEETGVQLLRDETVIDLCGERVLLVHGDALCTDDTEYMQFRAMVRNPEWQQKVMSLPLDQRRQMAAGLRAQSKSLNAMKAEDIMDVNQSAVEQCMEKHAVKRLIHGHTHRPSRHEISLSDGSLAERIVLGDWNATGWCIKADDDIELMEFDLAPTTV